MGPERGESKARDDQALVIGMEAATLAEAGALVPGDRIVDRGLCT